MQRSCCRSSDKTGAQPCASKQQSNVRCIVPSCCNPLSRPYNLKKRLCTLHMKADAVQRRGHGEQWFRYCQQCGKLEPLERFQGMHRSCAAALQRRRANARTVSAPPSADCSAPQPPAESPTASSVPQSPGPWQQQQQPTASGAAACRPSSAPVVAWGGSERADSLLARGNSSTSMGDAAGVTAQAMLADTWVSNTQACSLQHERAGREPSTADSAAADEWVQFLVHEASLAQSCCTTDTCTAVARTVCSSDDTLMSDAELEAMIEAALREAVSTAAGAASSGAPAPGACTGPPQLAALQQAAGATASGAGPGAATATVAVCHAQRPARPCVSQQQQQQLGVVARLQALQAQYAYLRCSVKGMTDALQGIVSLQCADVVAASAMDD